ncbi:MAG TPA: hypothetical protein VM865_10660 [Acidobacteriaceae bacterium]|jgi:putative membrane protein (TIGR04086 family)|nr:hypothetical protein [Acidobacteriaceae bacterium]
MKAFWSIFAVVDGFLSTVVLLALLTFVVPRLMHVRTDAPSQAYLIISVLYSVASAAVGGWVAARVARHRTDLSPFHHAVALAAVFLLLGAINIPKALGGPEAWYPIALTVLAPLACIAAGRVVRQRKSRGRA